MKKKEIPNSMLFLDELIKAGKVPKAVVIANTEKKEELNQVLQDKGIHVELDAASEYLLDHEFFGKLDRGEILSFGKNNYVLVEMSFFNAPNNLRELLFEIQLRGYKPILQVHLFFEKLLQLPGRSARKGDDQILLPCGSS